MSPDKVSSEQKKDLESSVSQLKKDIFTKEEKVCHIKGHKKEEEGQWEGKRDIRNTCNNKDLKTNKF